MGFQNSGLKYIGGGLERGEKGGGRWVRLRCCGVSRSTNWTWGKTLRSGPNLSPGTGRWGSVGSAYRFHRRLYRTEWLKQENKLVFRRSNPSEEV